MSRVSLRQRQVWVDEAKESLRQTKDDAWRCMEAVDGKILTDEDVKAMIGSGIDPILINRIFPVIGLLSGMQSINRPDTMAKGRTSKDGQNAENITEGIKYVMQQNSGDYLFSAEFQNQIKGGLGYLSVEDNLDPRQEGIKIKQTQWNNFWYDPFAPDPWLNPDTCRYCFNNPWMDLDELTAKFPAKKGEIEDQFNSFRATIKENTSVFFEDQGDKIEERKVDAKFWINVDRKRVRPVEMWYTQFEKTVFATFPDGAYAEITDGMDWEKQKDILNRSQSIIPTTVRKMYVSIFFGEIEITNERSKLPHDQFKYVPFVGYLDRYGFPYGVPMHLIGLNVEVIKRRSMALALLKSRRVMVEEDAAPNDDPKGLENIYDETQKMDGFIVLAKNALSNNKIKIEEMGLLLQGQEVMTQACENEIKEISGVNDESQGWQSNAQSGKALELKIKRSATTTAQMFDNASRSQKIKGELITSMIQGRWTGEKILRVTDNLTGAEKFVELNKKVEVAPGVIEVRNDITQGRYDLIISEAEQTDAVRERNMSLIIEWMDKAPDDIKPILMAIAMEISDLHNKDVILAKLRPIMGIAPGEEDMSPEQMKEQQRQAQEAAQQEQQQAKAVQDEVLMVALETKKAELEKLLAEIKSVQAETALREEEVKIKRETADADNFVKGAKIGKELRGDDEQE